MTRLRDRISAAGRRLWADEAGASAVEFSIVGSIFVIVTLGLLQLGYSLQVRNEIAKAVDEAARFAMLPNHNPDEFEAKLEQLLSHYDDTRLTIADPVEPNPADAVPFWVFSAEYEMPFLVPFISTTLATVSVSRRAPDLSS